MMLLGVFFHGALSFMATPVPWFVRDRSTHLAVDFACWLSHGFRMPVFFLLSGFFARLLLERRSLRGLLAHRAKRILVPFAVFLPPVLASLGALYRWGHSVSPPPAPLPRFPVLDTAPELRNLHPAHLWFLYYLLLLTAGAVGLVVCGLRAGPRTDRVFRWIASQPFLAALPTALALHFMPSIEVDTPVSFVPDLPVLAFYALLFGFGWLLHRQPRLAEGRVWTWLVLALLLVPVLALALDRADADGSVRSSPWRPAALYASALFTWTMALFLLGAFARWLDRSRPWVRWLSDSSYWVYLLHLPVGVFFQVACARLAWPGPVKYVFLVVVPTLAVCLATYALFVRRTWLGRMLNGPRPNRVP
jgi:peptidoglycan/LPS O-acetylase OafA/YrhL